MNSVLSWHTVKTKVIILLFWYLERYQKIEKPAGNTEVPNMKYQTAVFVLKHKDRCVALLGVSLSQQLAEIWLILLEDFLPVPRCLKGFRKNILAI